MDKGGLFFLSKDIVNELITPLLSTNDVLSLRATCVKFHKYITTNHKYWFKQSYPLILHSYPLSKK